MTEIARSKDGVPIWNGEASSFQEFEEASLIWEQATAMNKRYLCGPKLIAELTGAAKRLVAGKRHDWVSHNNGVQELMKHLRSCLGKPQVSELTEHLNRYFKNSRRRANESINEYITRKCEVYLRACQALQRVTPFQDGNKHLKTAEHVPWGAASRRSSWASTTDAETPETSETRAAAPTPDDWEQDDEASNQDDWTTWRQGSSWNWYSYEPWWGYQGGYGYWNWDGSSSNQWSSKSSVPTVPELLPDFVQGWYLLQDSGLDQSERNIVLTALNGNFSVQRVAQELRNQWSGCEPHRRREFQGKQSGFWGDVPEGDEDETEDYGDTLGDTEGEMNEEGQALMADAESEVQAAMAAIQTAKKTVREARTRQHNVRMARQYYRPQSKGSGRGSSSTPDDSRMTCLRCGRVGHRVANCPQPPQSAQMTSSAEATSSFVFFHDGEAETAYQVGPTTAEAVQQGKAVIDGGATRTLASVSAVEAIMSLNQAKRGDSGVAAVDLCERPIFGFGNGEENQCASTINLKIAANQRQGELRVHCLDKGDGPLLLSVDSLRKMKAVVDFAEDLICFRALDPRCVVKVERSATGHQLLPMPEDLLQQGYHAKTEVPSLQTFLEKDA